MKHNILYFAMALIASACTCDELVSVDPQTNGTKKVGISFNTKQHNITRVATPLQEMQRYNFGVFGYKSTDATNPIMYNYLVGYFDEDNKRGYYLKSDDQTTLGDKSGESDGKSYWAYEKLGSSEYSYTGTDGYFTTAQTSYMSNIVNQYLRYWDYYSPTTTFYAYSPYINGEGTATYDNNTKKMSIPDGSLTDGYDDPALYEYMWASATVANEQYAKDVTLAFKRLNAKINIKFWEDLAGYSVKIIDLREGVHKDVQATPAIKSGTSYSGGQYYTKSGFSLDFSLSVTTPAISQASGTTATNTTPLVFAKPVEDAIGETRETASASPTTYFAIPKSNTTGFTFHVSFLLTSTTGEKITVKNATVFVPADMCNWTSNTAYTYTFKITKNTNGSSDPTKDSSIDPTNPSVDLTNALYPIVFDGANVEDWTPNAVDNNLL